jgi:hypothetical protein
VASAATHKKVKAKRASAGQRAAVTSGGAGLGAPIDTLGPTVSTPSTPAHPTVPGLTAKVIRGVAYAPASAPIQVQRAIWAGNVIRLKPYVYGGGHGTWNDTGYDCSGSVSYVLHAAGLMRIAHDSSDFMTWGKSGEGQWITVYTNPGHAFVEIAGIRLDTSAEGDAHVASGSGPRWRQLLQDTTSYQARHLGAF